MPYTAEWKTLPSGWAACGPKLLQFTIRMRIVRSADLHSFSLLWPLNKSWVDALCSKKLSAAKCRLLEAFSLKRRNAIHSWMEMLPSGWAACGPKLLQFTIRMRIMQSADLHSFSLLWPLSKSWVDTLCSTKLSAPSAGRLLEAFLLKRRNAIHSWMQNAAIHLWRGCHLGYVLYCFESKKSVTQGKQKSKKRMSHCAMRKGCNAAACRILASHLAVTGLNNYQRPVLEGNSLRWHVNQFSCPAASSG